jgi:hypothetical protein
VTRTVNFVATRAATRHDLVVVVTVIAGAATEYDELSLMRQGRSTNTQQLTVISV